MSAASGISVGAALKTAWSAVANDSSVRVVKVTIAGNEMIESSRIARHGSLADDWSHIAGQLDKNPCYLLVRLDTKTATGDAFLLILYVPEATAQVRDKMLYASSRDALKRDLGRSLFVEDYFAADAADMTHAAWTASHAGDSASTDALLTAAERAKKDEARMEKDVGGSKDNVHGVAFALTDAARAVLQSFASGSANWASVTVDTKKETIEAGEAKNVTAETLNEHISGTHAFFYFYRYDHTDNKDAPATVNVFVYCCPEDVAIKQKMVMSSTKGAVISSAESLGIKATKKCEITDPADFSIDDVYAELYPEAVKQKVITRTAAPSRGGRRLIKKTT